MAMRAHAYLRTHTLGAALGASTYHDGMAQLHSVQKHLTRDVAADSERRQPQAHGRGTRDLIVSARSYNAAARSVEAVLSAGTSVRRFYFTEELEISSTAIDLTRVDAGICPLLDSHDQYRLDAAIGRVASVRIDNGKLIGTLVFADTENGRAIEQRVASGELRAISIGYRVTRWQITATDEDDHETWRAVAWELLEASLVSVPADPAAVVRHHSADGAQGREDDMYRNMPAGGAAHPNANRGAANRRPVTADEIREVCSRSDDYSRAFERELLSDHEQDPLSRREFENRLSEHLLVVRQRPSVDPRAAGRAGEDSHDLRRNFSDALYARLTNTEAPEAAREYRHAGLVDFARALLESRGERVRWMRGAAVVDAICRSGSHTSSDFAAIIQDAGARYLLNTFSQVPSPLKVLARKRDFPDFKTRYGIQAEASAPGLRQVLELGEYKRIGFNQAENGAKLSTYGEIFAISRQALINDDLGVFSDMSLYWARMLGETEASLLAGMIQGSGVLMTEDGKPLYHADHGNIAATPAGITVTSLAEARQQQRLIKNRDGLTPANVVPKYLVVGPAKETEAEQVLATINAGAVQDVNPFSGRLELVVDPRLAGNSWRLFADPAVQPVLEYGNLEGHEGLHTDVRIGFDVDGVEFKARTDLGAGAIDYRGTLLNQGN